MFEPLRPVTVRAVEIVTVPMQPIRPLRTARGSSAPREVLLVHVRAEEAEGWAEVAVEPAPTYASEFTAEARLVLAEHLVPLAWAGPTGDGTALASHLARIRGHHAARAALELAVLDAQLRAEGRALADWLGVTPDQAAVGVPAGAALGLPRAAHDVSELLAEADEALAAGAARLRVKVAPGVAAAPLRSLRAHLGDAVALQVDANGSFRLDDADHLDELRALDEVGLACIEQPLAPDDLVGHAHLATLLHTPICLDEPLTSVGALEAAAALGACAVVCCKPGRVGGWPAARRFLSRSAELGLGAWVGGMHESAIGRAANLALAATLVDTEGALAPDLDPRGRFDPDLDDPRLPAPGPGTRRVAVPSGPGVGAAPPPSLLVGAGVDVLISREPR